MADFAQTIVNTLTPLGIGVVNLWGTMEWNDHWGSNADAYQDVGKGLDMADLTLTPTIGNDVVMTTGGNTLTPSDAWGKDAALTRTDSVGVVEDLYLVVKRLAAWEYIFTYASKDGRLKQVDGWTKI